MVPISLRPVRETLDRESAHRSLPRILAQTHIDTGGEFIILPARELGGNQRQTEKDPNPAPDCLRRPQPHVTSPQPPLAIPGGAIWVAAREP